MTSQTYYWIKAEHGGKTILILPKGENALTEDGAYQWGFQKLPHNFEVVGLPTRDISRASRLLKGRRLDETGNIDSALEKYQHKVGNEPKQEHE